MICISQLWDAEQLGMENLGDSWMVIRISHSAGFKIQIDFSCDSIRSFNLVDY